MTMLTICNQREYTLDYENEQKDIWIFTSVKDLFDEFNRIGETSVKIFINLPPWSQSDELKIWKRIIKQAKVNRFSVKVNDDLTTGYITRKII